MHREGNTRTVTHCDRKDNFASNYESQTATPTFNLAHKLNAEFATAWPPLTVYKPNAFRNIGFQQAFNLRSRSTTRL